jgi:hypothetical protein
VIAGYKPARRFCEDLGATLLVEQPFEWDGLPLIEAGYGFSDIDALIRICEASADRERPDGATVH